MPPVERHNTPVVLFVTMTIRPRGTVLANSRFHDAFRAACAEADAWRVSSYVVMPDHIHLFCVPNRFPMIGVNPWCEYLKRRITRILGPHPEWEWLPDCWDTQLRTRDAYDEKRCYVRLNPVRASLVQVPDEWPWQGEDAPVMW
jgi:putative transposase